ncbi:MAG: 3-dehydroquinate synthase [Clostridia bacterium]|nr:3-dehydroquinate synthase [Clostridia bacterium]
MMSRETVRVKTIYGGYDVVMEEGALSRIGEFWDLDRNVLIVTDDGVPPYAEKAAESCKKSRILTLPQGEATKCEKYLAAIWKECCDMGLTRTDCIVAVGGGVVGDLSGFAAATYMRGIDFYNIPTTVLSQVDSSVGGKTAIDFDGYKNIVGAFYDPKGVLIDGALLSTLDRRQFASGISEAVKMAATFDADLFSRFENGAVSYTELIREALKIKIKVVEEDARESGLRKVLNFGHTIAHAIESTSGFEGILHGEAVAIGMIPMAKGNAGQRIKKVLEKEGLPTSLPVDPKRLTDAVCHDKKMSGDTLSCVVCPEIGKYEIVKMTPEEFEKYVTEAL